MNRLGMTGSTDKVALIVGGAHGIGRACTIRLASEGARVTVIDLGIEGATGLGSRVIADNEVIVCPADATNFDELRDTLQTAITDASRIDGLVNVGRGGAPDMSATYDLRNATESTGEMG